MSGTCTSPRQSGAEPPGCHPSDPVTRRKCGRPASVIFSPLRSRTDAREVDCGRYLFPGDTWSRVQQLRTPTPARSHSRGSGIGARLAGDYEVGSLKGRRSRGQPGLGGLPAHLERGFARCSRRLHCLPRGLLPKVLMMGSCPPAVMRAGEGGGRGEPPVAPPFPSVRTPLSGPRGNPPVGGRVPAARASRQHLGGCLPPSTGALGRWRTQWRLSNYRRGTGRVATRASELRPARGRRPEHPPQLGTPQEVVGPVGFTHGAGRSAERRGGFGASAATRWSPPSRDSPPGNGLLTNAGPLRPVLCSTATCYVWWVFSEPLWARDVSHRRWCPRNLTEDVTCAPSSGPPAYVIKHPARATPQASSRRRRVIHRHHPRSRPRLRPERRRHVGFRGLDVAVPREQVRGRDWKPPSGRTAQLLNSKPEAASRCWLKYMNSKTAMT